MRLEVKNVVKRYGDFCLNCNFTLDEGKITGIVGRNGAGKSTTFKAILGLLQLDEGEVLFDEKSGIDKNLKQDIGVVMSDSGFSEYLTIKDIMSIASGLYKKFNKTEFEKKCKHFSLPLNQKIKEFSTGMKVKLKVLFAMSYDAKLLLLDEPTVGLDVVVREEILDMLRNFMEEEGHSILISSHISSDLESLCDDFFFIENGKIILHEETDVLLDTYGVLKLSREQYEDLDKKYIVACKKENFGYACLTNEKQFYMENYPKYVIEKGNINELITIMLSDAKKGDF